MYNHTCTNVGAYAVRVYISVDKSSGAKNGSVTPLKYVALKNKN